jgi:ubiquinone/menaquinone biosynthesis C-methylase UbiE
MVADFFRMHVKIFGENWRALGWQSRRTQYRRFAVLAEIAPLAHTRVLDVGCGLGDLYDYLRDRNIPVTYTGYDLVPDMVERAAKRFPEVRFAVRDAVQGLGDEPFDYILSSGAFNINFGDNLATVQNIIREMFRLCLRGVAISLLSTSDPLRDPFFYHYDPQEMQAFCQTFCPHVRLREDYLPNDLTLYLYREAP